MMGGLMEQFPCAHCNEFFTPRNRKQKFCNKADCQRARKAAWQRNKTATDPDYKADQKLSQKKWAENNPAYWKAYRRNNPKKTERNRMLQTVRNRRRKTDRDLNAKMDATVIAKMDARKSNKFNPVGQFWLIPIIAKMDATKVNIYAIPPSCQ